MAAVTVVATAGGTEIYSGAPCGGLIIQNLSAVDIYVVPGSTVPTTANGVKIAASGGVLNLPSATRMVGIAASATADVRVIAL